MSGGNVNDLPMIADGRVDEQRLRMRLPNHRIDFCKEKLWVELELFFVFVSQRLVRLFNADQLNLGMVLQLGQEATHVSMYQTDHGNADGAL